MKVLLIISIVWCVVCVVVVYSALIMAGKDEE